MPATPAMIGFVLQEGRGATWNDAAVKTRYGNAARDTADEPIMTYFDDVSSAQAMANERGAIIGAEARRFVVVTSGLIDLDFATELPDATVIDDEKDAAIDCKIVSVTEDEQSEKTELMLWGTL